MIAVWSMGGGKGTVLLGVLIIFACESTAIFSPKSTILNIF